MSTDEIKRAVREHAPELDPEEVRAFMEKHDKPAAESDSHAVWAAKVLRARGEGQYGDGAPLDTVTEAMRYHDKNQ